MDNRLVPIRKSSSARDFWSRLRDEEKDVSPDFKVRNANKEESFILPPNTDTPFGRQDPPFSRKRQPLKPITNNSRVIERKVLTTDIENGENDLHKLINENAHLKLQVQNLLRINHMLTREMVRKYND